MAVNHLERDFFAFIDEVEKRRACSPAEGVDLWRVFQSRYYRRHRAFLSAVWFKCQGYTRTNIRERVRAIKLGDYAGLREALAAYDVDGCTRTVLERCALHSGDFSPCEIYLFVGFFSPDAFVVRHEGSPVICVGLERFRSFRTYPVLLAHEFCHLAMMRKLGGTGKGGVEADGMPSPSEPERVSGRLVREGIAAFFSGRVWPDEPPHVHLFIDERRFRELSRLYPSTGDLRREIVSRVSAGRDIFHGHGEDCHPRLGYYLGYRLVGDFARRKGIEDFGELLARYDDIFVDFGLR